MSDSVTPRSWLDIPVAERVEGATGVDDDGVATVLMGVEEGDGLCSECYYFSSWCRLHSACRLFQSSVPPFTSAFMWSSS